MFRCSRFTEREGIGQILDLTVVACQCTEHVTAGRIGEGVENSIEGVFSGGNHVSRINLTPIYCQPLGLQLVPGDPTLRGICGDGNVLLPGGRLNSNSQVE